MDCRSGICYMYYRRRKQILLSLNDNGSNRYLSVNKATTYQFKGKDPELVSRPLCLGGISKCFSINNTKKIGLNGHIYGFSVDFGGSIDVDVDDVLYIHKYVSYIHFMKKG